MLFQRLYRNALPAALFGLLAGLTACQDKDVAYDIPWPVPAVKTMTPEKPEVDQLVTLQGEALDKVDEVMIGDVTCTIVSKSATQLTFKVHRSSAEGYVFLQNTYKQKYTTTSRLQPTYPATRITKWPDLLKPGQSFKLAGDNLDMTTQLTINGQPLSVEVNYDKPGELVIKLPADLPLKGDKAVLQLTAKGTALAILSPQLKLELNTGGEVALADPILLTGFEEGDAPATPFNSSAVKIDLVGAGGAVAPAQGSRHLRLRLEKADVATMGNWSWFAQMPLAQPDLSAFKDPHLTFWINTNGTQVYLQAQREVGGQKKGGDLFTKVSEGWQLVSVPMSALAGGWGDAGPEDMGILKFGFTTASLTEAIEVNLDDIWITDGAAQAPASATLADFEDGVSLLATEDWMGAKGTGSINGNGLKAPQGGNYQSVTLSAQDVADAGTWKWYGSITFKTLPDMSAYKNPHLVFWLNTNGTEVYLQAEKAVGGKKLGGDVLKGSTSGWQRMEVPLSVLNGAWGDTPDPDYIRFGFTTGELKGPFQIHLDDVRLVDKPAVKP